MMTAKFLIPLLFNRVSPKALAVAQEGQGVVKKVDGTLRIR